MWLPTLRRLERPIDITGCQKGARFTLASLEDVPVSKPAGRGMLHLWSSRRSANTALTRPSCSNAIPPVHGVDPEVAATPRRLPPIDRFPDRRG